MSIAIALPLALALALASVINCDNPNCGVTHDNSRGREYLRGKYHCTIDLLFDWFGIS
jgi:hypothetical protein